MGTAPRVAIYARLSVDRDGKKVGIDTQVEDSLRLAAERGWSVVDHYVDRSLTAADKLVKRPEYDRLVADFDAQRFDALICWDLDRLTRQPRQLEDWIDAAEGRGLALVTANGEADLSTDGGRLYARLKVAVAKGETERASARQKRNKQHRRENGLWHGGQIPFGYELDAGELVPSEDEKGLIEEAARRLLDFNEPMHSIVKDWNDHGITTRSGKHWRQSNLRSILTNRSLLGETKAGVKGWYAILEQRTFDRLEALFNDPSRKVTHSPGVKGGKYTMGGGLTVCARCGKPLTSQVRHGSRSPSLICNKQVQGPHEKHPQVERIVRGKVVLQDTGRVRIDHDSLEAYVFDRLMERLNEYDTWRQGMVDQDPDLDQKVDALERRRAELRDERGRAGRSFIAGIMSEVDSKREVDRVDAELESVQSQINDLLGRSALPEVLAEDIDWKAETPGVRRSFLRLFIERVEVSEWPEGVSRNPIRKRDESDEAYAERQRAHRTMALDKRVNVVWKWAA